MRIIARPSIHTASAEMLTDHQGGSPGNGVWPAANDALFLPLTLWRPVLVKRLFCINGNVAAGNVDMGIYTAGGGRIVSIGSTAQSGTSAPQFFNITDTYLSPGCYYLALAASSTSAVFRRWQPSIIRLQHMAVYKMASALALPETATFATVTATYLPLIGIDLGGTL